MVHEREFRAHPRRFVVLDCSELARSFEARILLGSWTNRKQLQLEGLLITKRD